VDAGGARLRARECLGGGRRRELQDVGVGELGRRLHEWGPPAARDHRPSHAHSLPNERLVDAAQTISASLAILKARPAMIAALATFVATPRRPGIRPWSAAPAAASVHCQDSDARAAGTVDTAGSPIASEAK